MPHGLGMKSSKNRGVCLKINLLDGYGENRPNDGFSDDVVNFNSGPFTPSSMIRLATPHINCVQMGSQGAWSSGLNVMVSYSHYYTKSRA